MPSMRFSKKDLVQMMITDDTMIRAKNELDNLCREINKNQQERIANFNIIIRDQ